MPKYDPTNLEDMVLNFSNQTFMMRHLGGKVQRVWLNSGENEWNEIPAEDADAAIKDFEERAARPDFATIPRFFRNPLKLPL